MSSLSAIKVCLDTNNFVEVYTQALTRRLNGQLPTHSFKISRKYKDSIRCEKDWKGLEAWTGTRIKRSCGFSADGQRLIDFWDPSAASAELRGYLEATEIRCKVLQSPSVLRNLIWSASHFKTFYSNLFITFAQKGWIKQNCHYDKTMIKLKP